ASGIQALEGFAAPPLDLNLAATSPNIDAGVSLPGFNDDFCGADPDIGALELCPPATVPPAPDSLPVSPLPTSVGSGSRIAPTPAHSSARNPTGQQALRLTYV